MPHRIEPRIDEHADLQGPDLPTPNPDQPLERERLGVTPVAAVIIAAGAAPAVVTWWVGGTVMESLVVGGLTSLFTVFAAVAIGWITP